MQHTIKLKIADIVVKIESMFARQPFSNEMMDWRFNSFLYQGKLRPDITIKVEVVDKIPQYKKASNIFITNHFQDGQENWRLMQKDDKFIYRCDLKRKKQLVLINKTFDVATVYLNTKKLIDLDSYGISEKAKAIQSEFIQKRKGYVWNISDIIYDFLQVLLINYLALKKEGIFTHAIGIKDTDGKGLLFSGKSGAGKSTTARLWYKHSKAMILNDDRIIIRKRKKRFFIHGCPWHGDFDDYLASRIESVALKKLFFIHHAAKNTLRPLSQKEAFILLYPNLFPTFWNKKCLNNTVAYSVELLKNIGCFGLGFKNNRKIINFVRK